MTMLASAVGVVIVSLLSGLVSLLFFIAMVVAIGSSGKDSTTVVLPHSVLKVELSKISGDRVATDLSFSFSEGKTVGLVDAVHAIQAAATDDKITALYLTGAGEMSVSWGSGTELRDALQVFAQSGKPIVAYDASYSQGAYYLCSVADRLCLHPAGMVDFRGMGAEVIYYKDLLEKLGVEMQLVRPASCDYKSAGEVYTLNHMSAANREQIRAYIASIWNTATASIAESRGLSVADLNRIADDLSGYLATDALATRMVDTLCFEADVKAMLRDRYDGKQMVLLEKYAANVKAMPSTAKDAVAVIYAEGDVVDGTARGFSTAVYGDDIVKALRDAADDDDVKAIVLRVNSPGGQATASESMVHAVMAAREKKPVVVSMGDLAASAGYEMSCMADVIVAQPTTITGSIGVFGVIPNTGKLLRQKLGLNSDTVGTNRNSNGLSAFRPLSPTAMAMMERNVEDFYKVFVGRVAEGRHMDYEAVHRIARGRVWTGADALGIGLVDTLGGIDLAIAIAAQRAGIADAYRVKELPVEKDTWEQLASMFGNGDDDLSLMAKLGLAARWKLQGKQWKPLSRLEQDLLFVSQSEGVMARLPFVLVAD